MILSWYSRLSFFLTGFFLKFHGRAVASAAVFRLCSKCFNRIILSIYCENLIIIFFPSQMDKMSAYFLEIINKTITVGITDDLFLASEKAQIIDDYSEWINKNNDEMATGYVICTCYVYVYTRFAALRYRRHRCRCRSESSRDCENDMVKKRK